MYKNFYSRIKSANTLIVLKGNHSITNIGSLVSHLSRDLFMSNIRTWQQRDEQITDQEFHITRAIWNDMDKVIQNGGLVIRGIGLTVSGLDGIKELLNNPHNEPDDDYLETLRIAQMESRLSTYFRSTEDEHPLAKHGQKKGIIIGGSLRHSLQIHPENPAHVNVMIYEDRDVHSRPILNQGPFIHRRSTP